MPTKCLINAGEYRDSVTLVEIARDLTQLPGIVDAAVMMATERGLLMMGPDCGTTIIHGTALGFANAVPRSAFQRVKDDQRCRNENNRDRG